MSVKKKKWGWLGHTHVTLVSGIRYGFFLTTSAFLGTRTLAMTMIFQHFGTALYLWLLLQYKAAAVSHSSPVRTKGTALVTLTEV